MRSSRSWKKPDSGGAVVMVVWSVACIVAGHESHGREPLPGDGGKTRHTRNFVVISHNAAWSASDVAGKCEKWRQALFEQWCPSCEVPEWVPRALVVVHASEGDYLREVGRNAVLTRGVCRVERQHGQIVSRRIDLMTDPITGDLTALAHEMTHAVLADFCSNRRLPRWADEGIASCADPPPKKELHRQAVHRAIQRRKVPTIVEMLRRSDYPAAHEQVVFYGQSLMFVEFLAELQGPRRVLEFVQIAADGGYELAARQVYGFDDMADLEFRWRAHLRRKTMRATPVAHADDRASSPLTSKRQEHLTLVPRSPQSDNFQTHGSAASTARLEPLGPLRSVGRPQSFLADLQVAGPCHFLQPASVMRECHGDRRNAREKSSRRLKRLVVLPSGTRRTDRRLAY